ncbi:MAG: bifunctional adenosylcobinamide kinase/adenosylcobinamide-phosphate guanylyltransferase [Verrucomicrobia bacterium]|nr:bifunctional adenosylcobinamide kinase/adenosylcobinamide-phosphate guanylyltransferase [Verrucomicrobiota bacterium]
MTWSLHLVLGGARSGKSQFAEAVATARSLPVCYIASFSNDGSDAEMEARIKAHRARRPSSWKTVENRFDLRNVILESENDLLLLDCLTLWLSFRQGQGVNSTEILTELESAIAASQLFMRSLIIVSSEIGMDIIPETISARQFRDLCGTANQLVANRATKVDFIVAGLPLHLKGGC